ncbi:MAG: hypothetical protein FJ265_03700 [Planctomycetes bacterium]|nr:hypothetical protein [Planctomycetota bacterium]
MRSTIRHPGGPGCCGLVLAALSLPSCGNRVAPEMAPRVLADAGRVQKAAALAVPGIGDLSVLAHLPLVSGGPAELVAAGSLGFTCLDPATLQVRERTAFRGAPGNGRIQVRDVDGDGAVEFVQLGENWIGKTAVFDRSGTMRWQDEDAVTKRGPNTTEVVDFDGDGRCEFVTAFNVEETLRVAGCDGALLRDLPCGKQTTVLRALDLDGDGRQELASLDGKALRIQDGTGRELTRLAPADCGYLSEFDLVRDPRPGPPRDCLLVGGSSGVSLWDLQFVRIELPGGKAAMERFGNFDGRRAVVRLGGAEWDVRAQRLCQQAWPAGFVATRLQLRFLDRDGACAYDEILRASGARETVAGVALFVGEAASPVGECLLVGYGSDLLVYRAK